MPPRAFPYALRIGTDICHIARVQRLISREIKEDPAARPVGLFKIVQRLFTDKEQDAFWLAYKSPANIFTTTELRLNAVSGYIAGRWAAKEAIIKAVKPRVIGFSEIQIFRSEGREPHAIVLDKPAPMRRPPREPKDYPRPPKRQSEAATDQMPSWMREDSDWIDEDILSNELQETPPKSREEWEPSKFENIDGQMVRLSISHDGEYATAVCLAITDETPDVPA